MSNPPKITVITVCLNAASTIGATIRSVLSQNYPRLEYIVVDGGSTDGTLDIVSRYSGSLARIISEPDRGIYDAFNKGIAASTGDVAGILNSGDLYAPWTLAEVRRAVEGKPGYGVYIGHTMLLDEEAGKWRISYVADDWREKLRRQMTFCHQSSFVARDVYAGCSYSLEYALASDWDYFLKLDEAGVKFFLIDAVLAAFLLGGVTTSKLPELLEEMTSIAASHKIDMAEMKKYCEAAMRSHYRVQWIKRMGLRRAVFRLRELTGVFGQSGKWTPSMEREMFLEYMRKLETNS